MKKFWLIVLLIAVWLPSAVAQTQTAPAPVAGGSAVTATDVRQQTFDIVWRTVKEKHFDPTFGGVDWDKVRAEYAPRVAGVKNDHELYELLQRMLEELHQSHFGIIPPEAIISEETAAPHLGGIGIDLRIINNQAVLTRVEPDSKAAAAGLRAGFIITKIDDTTVEQILARFTKSKATPAFIRLYSVRALLGRLGGAPETSVRIAYLDQHDQAHDVTLTRGRLKGEMSPAFGNFPPQYMEFEAKQLAGNIGYIRFNIFVLPQMEKIRAAIRQMHTASGIIIDLRGNPGGVGGMAPGIGGMLSAKEVSFGVMTMRSGHVSFVAFPQPGAYTGPVVIITDGGSASTSEVFAGGMQSIHRAVIVGERSLGAALPSVLVKLPTGALFQYAIADFKTPDGVLLEGRGVIPDQQVTLTRQALLEGRDPLLDAATAQIKKQ